jgi:transposase
VEHHFGIDVSLELSSACVVAAKGKIVKETKFATEPEVLVAFFKGLGFSNADWTGDGSVVSVVAGRPEAR